MFGRFIHHFWQFSKHVHGVTLVLLVLMLIGALVISVVEQMPIGDALYFSFITGLTVGYGDIVVKTAVGRMIAVLIGFLGIIFTGLVVAVAVRALQQSIEESRPP